LLPRNDIQASLLDISRNNICARRGDGVPAPELPQTDPVA
jgi:hypothetical protein